MAKASGVGEIKIVKNFKISKLSGYGGPNLSILLMSEVKGVL